MGVGEGEPAGVSAGLDDAEAVATAEGETEDEGDGEGELLTPATGAEPQATMRRAIPSTTGRFI